MPTVALHTLGCKLNYAETSAIGAQLQRRGYALVPFGTPADVCVINTCTVTARANRECRQIVRRARRSAPGTLVVVTGCYAQLEPEEVASIGGVDLVLGTREKLDLADHLRSLQPGRGPHVIVSEIARATEFGPAASGEPGGRTRAFLKVQDGCDYSCSFCTIPLARGVSRSQSLEETVRQARDLASAGIREIVLTGVNVGDYGRKEGGSLLALLEALTRVPGLARIRVSSIEPNLLTDDIITLVAGEEKLCKHFHIPLQNGTDELLRRMRRRYTAGFYAGLIARLRSRLPECGIGADVITGFPGETEELFEKGYRFLNELPVSYLHVFTYSERPNTPAAAMAESVEPKVRFRRSEMLRTLGRMKRDAFYRAALDRRATVLTEGETEAGLRFGFSDTYVRVGLPASAAGENEIVTAQLTALAGEYCLGRPVVREDA